MASTQQIEPWVMTWCSSRHRDTGEDPLVRKTSPVSKHAPRRDRATMATIRSGPQAPKTAARSWIGLAGSFGGVERNGPAPSGCASFGNSLGLSIAQTMNLRWISSRSCSHAESGKWGNGMCSRAAAFSEPSESEIDFFSYVSIEASAKQVQRQRGRAADLPYPHSGPGCDGFWPFGFRRRKVLKLRQDTRLPPFAASVLPGQQIPSHSRITGAPNWQGPTTTTTMSIRPSGRDARVAWAVARQSRAPTVAADHRRHPVGQPCDDRRRRPQPVPNTNQKILYLNRKTH